MSSDLATFYRRTRAARKIIVADLGFLGDSVHLVPALWELRAHYPGARLDTLSAPVGRQVLALAPCIDTAREFPLAPESPPWWRHWDVLAALRRERFDLAFNFSGADRSIFITAITGARWRVAHAAGRRHFWNRWIIPEWVPRQSRALPVFEQKRQVLAACGLALGPVRWDLRVPDHALSRAENLVPAGAIHFSVNASSPLKEWPLDHWIALARGLLTADERLRIVATASASARERQRLGQAAEEVRSDRFRALPDLGIPELAGVLRRCRLHVGADSGVLHLAAALGVRTLALFRDYEGKDEWLPKGPEHLHLIVPCECADSAQPPCANAGLARCLESITVDRVAAMVREAIPTTKAT